MLQQLAKIERRFLEIENLLSTSDVITNQNEFRKLSKERVELEEVVQLYNILKKISIELEETAALYLESSGELKELAFAEEQNLQAQRNEIEKQLSVLLLPKDPNDSKNIFLEIRAGAGGDEASLFAAQLFRAYCRYADTMRWKLEVMSMTENELGGIKEVIALIEGTNVYSALKYESGVHRVQRVPQTEAQGRVHTSTITVAILPEAEDIDISINENDLRIDTYRASGAGGQHVNRTDSAVRITHIPSGIVIACQDERSQIKNRAKAMKILKAKLLEAAEIEKEKNFSSERKALVGRGDRSERIRTYNFPQSRITDHRINFSLHSTDAFMEGDIQIMLDALRSYYQTQRLNLQAKGL